MTNQEAIAVRCSVRSYTSVPLALEKTHLLLEKIEEMNQVSGLAIELLEDGSEAFSSFRKTYGMFKNVRSLIILKGRKDEFLYEKAGYYGEKLLLEATRMGLGTCWIGGMFDREKIHVENDQKIVAVVSIGYPNGTQSVKEKLVKFVFSGKRKPIEHFYSTDITPPEWFLVGVEAVRRAPTAINGQKVHLSYSNEEVSIAVPETYVLDTVDLGIAKAHFELVVDGRFSLGNNAIFEKSNG